MKLQNENNEVLWWQWLITVNDIEPLWHAQPSYLISQALYMLAGLATLVHAFCKGGRWPYLWLGTLLHGIYADNFWHFALPEYDNFWHSQTTIVLLGGRLPLHIVFLYPAFIYQAAYAVYKLRLPGYAQPFAVGLLTFLIDIPYDIVAVKFVHWTWHDTDPNIYDRHYWVPWNSYYFHMTFAASFYFFFHMSRKWMAPNVEQWTSAKKYVEWKSLLIATALGMPGGVLLFIPIYHSLHDVFKIHTEVAVILLFSIFSAVVFLGILSPRETIKEKLTVMDYLLLVLLCAHYLLYWAYVVFLDPTKEVSVGLHEPVGPCDVKASLTTPFGQTLYKRKYLCAQDYDEGYFDFHCVNNKLPPHGSSWYTICGTPFENRMEYIVVLSTILLTAGVIFYGIYFKNRDESTANQSTKKLKKIN